MMKAHMKRVGYIGLAAAIILGLLTLGVFLFTGKQIDVLNPSGEIADQQRSLFLFTIFLSSLVVVPVFTMLAFFSVKYRAGNKKAKYTPDWGENKVLESLWWGIPIIIIGVLGVLTFQTSHALDPYKPLSGGEPLDVQVVALRWKWLFIYPEQKVATLNYVAVPVDRPVRFTMTADAPMSAFWIPALGSQVYAMSGMQSQLNLKANKIGEYTGYTTNINGEGYSKMTFKAKAMSEPDFERWSVDAEASNTVMNMQTYETLGQPKSETDERTYRLADQKLFETIANKYGTHSGHSMHGVSE